MSALQALRKLDTAEGLNVDLRDDLLSCIMLALQEIDESATFEKA
jgi:hypothetical protein